ncbi:MAG: hypothetical protein H6732_06470 [Alphaproteobacteria bacterium]|nr:hypothetical protein [Alphaproteobacteria bacterium]
MHEELATFDKAVRRLAHDTLVHLVRQNGRAPRQVRVAVPEAWDATAFAGALAETYAERGMPGVEVVVLTTSGEPRLLSVVTG